MKSSAMRSAQMTRRVMALAGYFFGSLLWSLYGWLFILLALACWQVLFDPQQGRRM